MQRDSRLQVFQAGRSAVIELLLYAAVFVVLLCLLLVVRRAEEAPPDRRHSMCVEHEYVYDGVSADDGHNAVNEWRCCVCGKLY